MTPLTWQVFFSPTPGHQRVVQQWLTENAPFFQTQEGAAYLNKINHIKGQYINNEKWWATYGQKAGRGNDYNKRKNELVKMFTTTRTNVQTAPTNSANQPPVGNAPTGAPTNAPVGAPPPPVAPPIYLPNVNAPQYMFPSAEAVRDMTYDPGIGGFLRPNQWQGAVPASPYGELKPPPGGPLPPSSVGGPQMRPQPQGSYVGQGQMQPGQFPAQGVPQAPSFAPGQFPAQGVPQGPPQFPWHPGY